MSDSNRSIHSFTRPEHLIILCNVLLIQSWTFQFRDRFLFIDRWTNQVPMDFAWTNRLLFLQMKYINLVCECIIKSFLSLCFSWVGMGGGGGEILFIN